MTRNHSPTDTSRLSLRRLSLDDADLMLAIWNDPAFIRHVADRGIRTLEAAREAMRQSVLPLYEQYGHGPYRVSLQGSDEPIGICGLFRRESFDDPDIGYALLPEHRSRGYAFESAQAVVGYARDELGIGRLIAIVSPKNPVSIGLLEKLGLVFERMHRMPGDDAEVAVYALRLHGEGRD